MEPLGAVKERNFHRFMAEAGDIEIGGANYPKLQMLDVPEVLEGKRFDTPEAVGRGLMQPELRLHDRMT